MSDSGRQRWDGEVAFERPLDSDPDRLYDGLPPTWYDRIARLEAWIARLEERVAELERKTR